MVAIIENIKRLFSSEVCRLVVSKLFTSRGAAFAMAFIMTGAGIGMISAGIYDRGIIDLAAPFVSGQVRSGSVGILLVAIAMFMVVVVIVALKSRAHRIDVKFESGAQFVFNGPMTTRLYEQIFVVIDEMRLDADKSNRARLQSGTPGESS